MKREMHSELIKTIKELTLEELVGIQKEIVRQVAEKDMTAWEVMIHGLADAFLQDIVDKREGEFQS